MTSVEKKILKKERQLFSLQIICNKSLSKCVREEVVQTYFAACPGFDADATVKESV